MFEGMNVLHLFVLNRHRGQDLRKIVRLIPKDKIMIETDGPFLTPQSGTPSGFRVKRNEPAFLPMILNELASCMGMTPKELAEASTKNAISFFNLPEEFLEVESVVGVKAKPQARVQKGPALASNDFPPLGGNPAAGIGNSGTGRGNGQARGGRVQRGGGSRGRGQ